MAKFRTGNLVLQSNQQIEQGSSIILNEDAVGHLDRLTVDSDTNMGSLVFALGGATIYEFDTDPDLIANSDEKVSTQQAVKAYVDAQVGGAVTSGTDQAVAIYDGVNSIQDSPVFIDSTSGDVTGIGNLTASGEVDCDSLDVFGNSVFGGDIDAVGDISTSAGNLIVPNGDVTGINLNSTGNAVNVGAGQIRSSFGNIELNYASSKKLETDSTGIIVTGNIHCDDIFTSGSTVHVGDGEIKWS